MAEQRQALLQDFESFESDEGTEAGGAWMDVPGKLGWAIRLRSQHCPQVRDAAAQLERKYTALYQAKKNVPATARNDDELKLLEKHIVVDWRGFCGPDGTPLPYTPVNALAVMKQYATFRDICLVWSNDRSNYRDGSRDAEAAALGETAPTA